MQHFKVTQHIQKRLGALEQDRRTFEATWREIQRFIMPGHGRGLSGKDTDQGGHNSSTEDVNGDNGMRDILDHTAGRAMRITAAGLMGGATSPSRPWFNLGVSDPELAENASVKQYLYEVENRMQAVFAKSGLYRSLHHCYAELAGFGTGAIRVLESFDSVLKFRPFTAGEYFC